MSKSKAEEIIENSIIEIQKRGIRLQRQAVYSWVGQDGMVSDTPTACNWEGAVLIVADKAKFNFPSGWYTELAEELKTNTYWLWRFHIGFDVGNVLTLRKDEGNKKDIEFQDPISMAGYRMAKRYNLLR